MSLIPEIHVEGTHFELGHAIGLKFKDMISEYIGEDKTLNGDFLPYIKTDRGRELYDGYLATVQKYYPQYIEELRGMTQATGIPFLKFFILAIRSELSSFLSIERGSTGCTDIYLKTKTQFALGHTEDMKQTHCGRFFIVQAVVRNTSTNQIEERFTAVTLAGLLPGNTFGLLLEAGLFYTINNLHPMNVQPNKIPRQILNRALLSARGFDHMLEISNCLDVGSANGCSINVGVYTEHYELWTVEIAPVDEKPVTLVRKRQFSQNTDEEYYQHLNKYKLIQIPELPGSEKSSDDRMSRILELPPPVDVLGIREILGDEEHEFHRLYNKNMPTGVATLFTVIVDIGKAQIQLFAENPKLTDPSNILQLQ